MSPTKIVFDKECRKKCETIMIGALDIFETHFGSLWGHQIEHEDKTELELELYKIWQAARKEILDLGNQQITKYEVVIKRGTKNE